MLVHSVRTHQISKTESAHSCRHVDEGQDGINILPCINRPDVYLSPGLVRGDCVPVGRGSPSLCSKDEVYE